MNTLSQIRLAITSILFAVATFTAQAQAKQENLAPQDGFWVVESAPKNRQSTIRFYTNDQKLIYQETMNRKLNINHKQTKRQLNAALEQAMFVWNATYKVPTDRQWVAVQFNKK